MFRPIVDNLRRTALRGLAAPVLFARYRETRDEAAVVELVARMTPRLRTVCRPYLQDRDEIDEVVQEVFRLLVERADSIRDENAVESWLDRTAVNTARNRSRLQSRRTPRPVPPDELGATDPAPGPELMAELREKYAHVLAEIDRLNEDWKRALTLKLLEERPYAEVAELLGASLNKVKQDVCRARKQLRWRLAKKGIVLPTALAGVLLGKPVQGRNLAMGLCLVGAAVTAATALLMLRTPTAPQAPTPKLPDATATRPVAPPDLPKADDVVLAKVVSLMDSITGMKTRRTEVFEDGPRGVRWRFAWTHHPNRDPNKSLGIGALLSEHSYVDLIFDRWSGKLDMELALDGKNARNIDPLRPIIIGPPAFEVVVPIPELVAIHQAFPMMLMTSIPDKERIGPPGPERVHAIVGSATDTDLARPEPDQGIVIRLEPGVTLSATRRPGPEGGRTVILFWRTGLSSEIHVIRHGEGPWSYRNDQAAAQDIFIAAICGKTERWMTCASRLTHRDDGTRALDFDEDYEGRFEDARLEVRLETAQ
jgi:RNA polymerase sigma factor (sigma-70 family)